MASNLKANCYRFANGCRKLYFSFVGRRKPGKVGKHRSMRCCSANFGDWCLHVSHILLFYHWKITRTVCCKKRSRVSEESASQAVLSQLCEDSACTHPQTRVHVPQGYSSWIYSQCLTRKSNSSQLPIFKCCKLQAKSLQVKWWKTKARFDQSCQLQFKTHAKNCEVRETHVFSKIGCSSQVFSTKSLVLQFGDDSVMVMACVLKYSTCVSLILKFLGVLNYCWHDWLSLAFVLHHFPCKLLLANLQDFKCVIDAKSIS